MHYDMSPTVRERLSPTPPASCLELPTSPAHAFSPSHDACKEMSVRRQYLRPQTPRQHHTPTHERHTRCCGC
jgi:hypothetical protein